MALAFAVEEINKNLKLLPNITLGFCIYDSYFSEMWTYRTTLELLSTLNRFIPSYKCDNHGSLKAVIGGLYSEISLVIAAVLNIYKIPQLTYGSAPAITADTKALPFYQMVANEAIQYEGILQLLLHFNWRWVGLLIADDDNGERFLQAMISKFPKGGICFALIKRVKAAHIKEVFDMLILGAKVYDEVMGNKANVFIFYGETQSMINWRWLLYLPEMEFTTKQARGKVWILTAQMDLAALAYQRSWDVQPIHGVLSLASHSNELQGFQNFLLAKTLSGTTNDGFIVDFWEQAFACVFQKSQADRKADELCTGEEDLKSLPGAVFEIQVTGHSYSIYNAAYTVAHALHAMQSSISKHNNLNFDGLMKLQDQEPWQLNYFLRGLSFNNSIGDTVSFNQYGEVEAGYDIINWVTFGNQSFHRVKVGKIDLQFPPDQAFVINEGAIMWHSWFNQTLPRSLCNDNCQPGYRRKEKEGKPFCCYDCIPCPKGETSDKADMDNCIKCPEDQYPNKDQVLCLPKLLIFLSYKDPLGIIAASFTVFFSLVTTLVLGVFLKHQNTPIVQANNQNLTYTLLISILLCFFCALLFIGKTETVMCLLRQVTFGLVFCVAVSSVLAKTIIVILAFMATKPGSKMRKWVRKRLAGYIVLSCSLVQAVICAVWLAISPPFPDYDMHSDEMEEMILECNEGSTTMFYCLVGYLGFLATVCFILAFLSRKVPDSFNEAKFITFSMLVFCSVWLSFIPSYLSTKGRSMVAVEIFSILASSAGLLCFIFFPKCFIILLKPELNRKEYILRRKC